MAAKYNFLHFIEKTQGKNADLVQLTFQKRSDLRMREENPFGRRSEKYTYFDGISPANSNPFLAAMTAIASLIMAAAANVLRENREFFDFAIALLEVPCRFHPILQ